MFQKLWWRLFGRKRAGTVAEMCRALVDIEYVLQRLPIGRSGDPTGRYLKHHANEIEPNGFFDYDFYRRQVGEEIVNPLADYVQRGEAAGLMPGPKFDPVHYRKTYPDTIDYAHGALGHFLKHGSAEGRQACSPGGRIVDTVDADPSGTKFSADAVTKTGESTVRRSSPNSEFSSAYDEFDAVFYRLQLDGRSPTGTMLEDYLEIGEEENKRPSLHFDPYFYRETYLASSVSESPLHHYRKLGRKMGYATESSPPVWKLVWPLTNDELKKGGVSEKARAYVQQGWRTDDPNPYFSLRHYLRQYPDLISRNINPLAHYLLLGEREGATPSDRFDPAWYYEKYPEVAAAKLSALDHYLEHGLKEGRAPLPPKSLRNWASILQEMAVSGCGTQPKKALIQLPVVTMKELATDLFCEYEIQASTFSGVKDVVASIRRSRCTIVIGGTRFVVGKEGRVAHDEAVILQGPHIRHEKYHGASRCGKRMMLEVGIRPGKKIERGIHVMHEYDANYFHFVAETLPRVALADRSEIPVDVPLLVSGSLHPNLMTLLRHANQSGRKIVELEKGVLHEVGELYYVGDCSMVVDAYDGGAFARTSYVDTSGVRSATRVVREDSQVNYAKKIFAIRNGKYRILLNQPEIQRALLLNGFKVVDCAVMSISEQVAAFKGASVIVSPTGAQLTNVVWCQEGCQVIVLASDHPSHQLYLWELLSRVSGAKVSVISGRSVPDGNQEVSVHSDYIVEVGSVMNELRVSG